jgi:hypothetical protein
MQLAIRKKAENKNLSTPVDTALNEEEEEEDN